METGARREGGTKQKPRQHGKARTHDEAGRKRGVKAEMKKAGALAPAPQGPCLSLTDRSR